MFFKRHFFILLFILLAGVFLVPAKTQAKALTCECFYKCDNKDTSFNKGPYVWDILPEQEVTACEDSQLKNDWVNNKYIPSEFVDEIRSKCKEDPSFFGSDAGIIAGLVKCQLFAKIDSDSIYLEHDQIGKEAIFSVLVTLGDANKQKVVDISCITCKEKGIQADFDGNTLQVKWLVPQDIDDSLSYGFTFGATVSQDGINYPLAHQNISIIFKPSPAAPAAPAAPSKKVDEPVGPSVAKDVNVSGLNKLGTTSTTVIIGRAIKTGMGIIGSIALVMFIYGGFLWMTAGGNSEHEKKARDILVWSSLGVVVILASYALVTFVFEAFK